MHSVVSPSSTSSKVLRILHQVQQCQNQQQKQLRFLCSSKRLANTTAIADNTLASCSNHRHEQRRRDSSNTSNKNRKQKGSSGYKFVDRARLRLSGGNGGNGAISYKALTGSYKKRPDGGNGGNGGFVVFVADPNEQSLNFQSHHYRAEDGAKGGGNQMHGRNGKDKIIRVPCGVVVKRVLGYDEIWDEDEGRVKKIKIEDDDDEKEFSGGHNDDEGFTFNSNHHNDGIEINHGMDIAVSWDRAVGKNPKKEHVSVETSQMDDGDIDSHDDEGADDAKKENDSNNLRKINKHNKPKDYDEVVDTGIKSKYDNMFHWSTPTQSDSTNENGLVSDSSEMSMITIGEMAGREKITIADLDKPGSYVVVAAGGQRGLGNNIYAKRQFAPHHLTAANEKKVGFPGEVAHVELELKLIADIGLVGFPNAGKSSLLAAMSMAKPAIAPYPFTTLHPLVGCVEYRDGFRALVADVPGLIDGAAEGRGRGHDFLRHLERTKALLFIVDAAGTDGRDPVDDLKILIDEIASYGDGDMMVRPALVVANKLDLIPDQSEFNDILLSLGVTAEEAGVNLNGNVIGISAGMTGEGLPYLSRNIRTVIEMEEANWILSS